MISGALARAHHLLNQDMLGYLDTVELLTNDQDTDDDTVLAVARTPWPCAVIDSAHTHLKDPDRVLEDQR
ncbi:hypothetical protein [Saccharothrix sp. HUAS TT1]|uniref:hypothetical protein n=1 Tax=unclassified Saccharothrix TaxID=2593673 RepID=UPI00345BE708